MERQLLLLLYRSVLQLSGPKSPCVQYPEAWIVLTYLWAVLNNKPVCWACQAAHWPTDFAAFTPPSSATMSRRLRTVEVQRLLLTVLYFLQRPLGKTGRKWVDAKPLPIGSSSGDRDAKWGRGAGGKAKGYKLHAVFDVSLALEAFQVVPMNVNEKRVAGFLLPQVAGPGLVLGDNQYDAVVVYEQAAAQHLQLIVNPRRQRPKDLGHQAVNVHRLLGMAWAGSPLGRALRKDRVGIDRLFGYWGNVYVGLNPLPNWVRGLQRVRYWVCGKLIILALCLTAAKEKYGVAA